VNITEAITDAFSFRLSFVDDSCHCQVLLFFFGGTGGAANGCPAKYVVGVGSIGRRGVGWAVSEYRALIASRCLGLALAFGMASFLDAKI
jgi:hypothetical protein